MEPLDISRIKQVKKFVADYSRFGEDYVFAHITPDNNIPTGAANASRFNGLTLILCLSGEMSIDVNFSTHSVTGNTLIISGVSDIIKINSSNLSNIDAYTLFLSSDFLHDINIDINTLNPQRFSRNRTPLIKLSEEEVELLKKYWELLHLNTIKNSESLYIKNISRNIIASIIYQIMQFASTRIEMNDEPKEPLSRRANYVYDFMRLVHKYHCRERSLSFYAEKLFITPKYLSIILKDVTGRTAADWIDDYVILEAKNLLRFSGKNIQQIAYELNFSNQSAFGKYFKHLTGMSPTEFQRT